MSRWFLLLVTVAFGAVRCATMEEAPPIELTFFNVFKDFAHVWVGLLIGGAIFTDSRSSRAWLLTLAVGVTAVETAAALLTIMKTGLQ
jgi:hypothetical protein